MRWIRMSKEVMVSSVFTAFLVLFLLVFPSSVLLAATASGKNAKNVSGASGLERVDPSAYPVSFAYLISASAGEAGRAMRLLAAVYHPANQYLLHLDREAPAEEHERLARLVASMPVFARVGNVWVAEKPNLVTYRGPTMLSTTLHALAVLLRRRRWDWFVNLSASDYPLVTQDDLIAAFSKLPRDLNFIEHTSHLGWKIKKRARPVIVDTALYEAGRSELLRPNTTADRRSLPTAFKLFTGSAWTVLSRSFAEYCIVGWDNLPRTLLLYYSNFISSPEFYFQTVACNSREFRNTTVSHDLRYITWDNPPKQHPLYLGLKDYRRMILSGAAFARKFRAGDPVVDRIDREILRRRGGGQFSYGGWCSGREVGLCYSSQEADGKPGELKAGAGSRRLRAMLNKLLSNRSDGSKTLLGGWK